MPLFQNSVLRNHLNNIDKKPIVEAFEIYKKEFLPKIANIKSSKEEQYQYGFLDDLFVKVLGYTLNPSPEYNLIAEQKNLSDSKKADGAVLREGRVIAVIELKSTKTKSMDKIVNQAFNYKHNHPACKYVITSNFEKLRLYVEHSDKFEEFNLFDLNEERFTLLYLLLSKENIFSDLAFKLKEQSKLQEENISNELYKKYAQLRTNLFDNIIHNNPEIDKYILLEKTQTILDRMVFIFFAEDRSILPPNTIQSIIDHYKDDIEDRELWHFYKIYFKAINEGNKKLNIPEYNGGLFATDALLESLCIDNHVIDACPLALSAYDFNSDIDVNILGHIFENSLNDIEELKARIEDADFDAKQSKRKKDGVFYTPEYITKYIVDNTLGSLCQAKKEVLGLDEVDILIPKNPKKLNKGESKQKEALEAYREYLLGLKILDPACGSGAFLNQTLNYLLEEHDFIDKSIKTLMGGSVLGLYDVKKGILENNLYGVDINAEAVEIAKLSLWLRTVESGRKLNKLADKIKVGNSLIDDKSVAEDAFVWEEEFTEVFEEGGFDVVIGNPPYVRVNVLEKYQKNYFDTKYESAYKQYDIYILFYELGLKLLNKNGYLSYITPNKFYLSDYGKNIREYILNNSSIKSIVDISMMSVFDDASVYPTIITLSKTINLENVIDIFSKVISQEELKYNKALQVRQNTINKVEHDFIINLNVKNLELIEKIENQGRAIGEFLKISRGFRPPKNELITRINKENSYPFLVGTALNNAYNVNWNNDRVIYIEKQIPESKPVEVFLQPKILIRDIGLKFNAYYDDTNFLCLKTIYFIYGASENDLKYVTVLLNSKLLNFYFSEKYSAMHISGGYLRFRKQFIEKVPLQIIENKQVFIEKLDLMQGLNKTHQTKKTKFLKRIKDNFNLDKLSKKLEAFYETDFKIFLKELKKKKVTLTLKEQDEWEEYFEGYQKELLELQDQIDATDKEIDKMVYELYRLSEDEVAVVEGRE